jgi:hypothetical protein
MGETQHGVEEPVFRHPPAVARLQRGGGRTIWPRMMEFRPSIKRKAAGWSLMGLGVVGIVLPFLQGFLFLALGMFVLRHQYFWAHRGMGWIGGRWPDMVTKIEDMETRMLVSLRAQTARLRGLLRRG